MIESNDNRKPRKWYTNYTFPLVPVLTTKKTDEHNTSGFSFHWLFFRVWSLDAFDFELALVADTHWGIGLTAKLPYLRIVACIPFPESLAIKVQRYLWRHPQSMKKYYNKELDS